MPHACRIDCATRSPDGEVLAYEGKNGDGRPWKLSREQLIQAIGGGTMTCYVTLEGHSHLVTVQGDAAGKRLVTFLGDLEALPLPQCR